MYNWLILMTRLRVSLVKLSIQNRLILTNRLRVSLVKLNTQTRQLLERDEFISHQLGLWTTSNINALISFYFYMT